MEKLPNYPHIQKRNKGKRSKKKKPPNSRISLSTSTVGQTVTSKSSEIPFNNFDNPIYFLEKYTVKKGQLVNAWNRKQTHTQKCILY